jgi:hypothetical protein
MSRGGGEFRRIFPNDGRQLFDGGKNSKYERSIIAPNESPDCANVVFTNGAVETRPGYTRVNTTSAGSFVCDALFTRRADSGAETLCAWYGGNFYTLGTTSLNTVPSGQSVFTAGIRVGHTLYENHAFMGNGGAIPYKYNGTDFTRHGIYPPTATASVASNGVGALTASGQYQYKVTYVNSALAEGDLGPATATFVISTTSGQNRISSLPVAPQSWGVSARRVYRNANGSTVFKRVGEVANNTATTFDDNVADAALGVTAPTDNGVPPNYSFILYHQNRLFMNDPANPNFLWFTELGEPYTVGSTNFIKAGDQAGDIVKGAAVYDNSIVILCEKSAWIVYMPDTDPTDWKVVKAKASFGSKSPYCVLEYDNKLLFVATQNDKIAGFAALSGDTVEPSASLLTTSSAGSNLKSDRIEPDVFEIQETYIGNISGIVYQNQAYITVTYGSGATTNNRVYLMDFSIENLSKKQRESWVPWTGMNAAQFAVYGGLLYFGSSTANGRLYRMTPTGYNDDGAAIDSYFWTKEFAGFDDETNFNKDFRYANLLLDTAGDYFMNLLYRVDSDTGGGTSKQIDLNPGGSLWGSMIWGVDSWGGGATQTETRVFLDTARGKRIQFKFTNQNTVDQRFKVHGLNFAYNLKGFR